METKEVMVLKAQLAKCRAIARDRLGHGVWGLEEKDKFTHEEIVFLFARIFPYLGFNHIKRVRTDFPDCIGVIEDKEVGIEFEPALSSFKNHIEKDDLSLCQYIVCWEDDVSLYDPIGEEIKKFNIRIIQLKKIYEEIGLKRLQKGPIDIDKLKLKPNQLKILKAFIDLGTNTLTMEEIAEATGIHGKALGGPLGAFILLQKGKIGPWILRQLPDKKWELNSQHRSKIIERLKELKDNI
jgi:hypothetical protein